MGTSQKPYFIFNASDIAGCQEGKYSENGG